MRTIIAGKGHAAPFLNNPLSIYFFSILEVVRAERSSPARQYSLCFGKNLGLRDVQHSRYGSMGDVRSALPVLEPEGDG